MNAGDFRELVVRPALEGVNLWSPIAEELLMGTAAVESGFEALEQKRGPAVGVFQVEPLTHHDLYYNYLAYRPELEDKALFWASSRSYPRPRDDELAWNLRYAAVICALIYHRRRAVIATDNADPAALAKRWKLVYNTPLGAGTVEHFVAAYERLVRDRSAID